MIERRVSDDNSVFVGLPGFFADTLDVHDIFRRFERTVLFPVFNNSLGIFGAHPVKFTQLFNRSGIDVDFFHCVYIASSG